jgi:hypothetical protein
MNARIAACYFPHTLSLFTTGRPRPVRAGDEVYGGLDLRKSIRSRDIGYVMAVHSNYMVTLSVGRRLTAKNAAGLVKPTCGSGCAPARPPRRLGPVPERGPRRSARDPPGPRHEQQAGDRILPTRVPGGPRGATCFGPPLTCDCRKTQQAISGRLRSEIVSRNRYAGPSTPHASTGRPSWTSSATPHPKPLDADPSRVSITTPTGTHAAR